MKREILRFEIPQRGLSLIVPNDMSLDEWQGVSQVMEQWLTLWDRWRGTRQHDADTIDRCLKQLLGVTS